MGLFFTSVLLHHQPGTGPQPVPDGGSTDPTLALLQSKIQGFSFYLTLEPGTMHGVQITKTVLGLRIKLPMCTSEVPEPTLKKPP